MKKVSTPIALVLVASLPAALYLMRVYGEIISKSTVILKADHPILEPVILIGIIPFIFITSIVIGYAKSEVYMNLKRENNQKVPRLLQLSFVFIAIIFFIYNIICIYIYIKYIGENPLLSWSEFLDFRH